MLMIGSYSPGFVPTNLSQLKVSNGATFVSGINSRGNIVGSSQLSIAGSATLGSLSVVNNAIIGGNFTILGGVTIVGSISRSAFGTSAAVSATSVITAFGGNIDAYDQAVLGTEQIVTGDFSSATGWTMSATRPTIGSGVGAWDNGDTSGFWLNILSAPIKPGAMYAVTFSVDATADIQIYDTGLANTLVSRTTYAAGTYTKYFTAPASSVGIYFYIRQGGAFNIDNASLKEIKGGNVVARGWFTGGGTLGIRVDGSGNAIAGLALGVSGILSIGNGVTAINGQTFTHKIPMMVSGVTYFILASLT